MTTNNARTLRHEVDQCLERGEPREAAQLLANIWRVEARSTATASFLVSRFEKIRDALELQSHRIAILRSATVEPAVLLLRAAGFVAGLDLIVHVGDFNAYAQEITNGDSSLYAFQPQTMILAVESPDCVPRLWQDWADLSGSEVKAEVRRTVDYFHQLTTSFRRHSQANLILHSLALPEVFSWGVLDVHLELDQQDAFHEINRGLRRSARDHASAYVLDYDGLVARHGRDNWRDDHKWKTVRIPFSGVHVAAMAGEWMRFLHPLSGKVAKLLVVDLDNTLWGGIIGEDGFDGIRVGLGYPGVAYSDLQRALLDLRQRGVLLAICSKNNAQEAMEALERHSEMLLRPEHFVSSRINWKDKATNLRAIATELNIGTDAIAYLDDNPVEREQVRKNLPEVMVIDMPDDPLKFARTVRDAPVFERLSLSQEDSQRAKMYHADRERHDFQLSIGDSEEFYRSLEQEVEIGHVSAATLTRVAQLTQKTNQFNLTTRRYSEQEIASMARSSDWRIYWLRVRDRFGDNGVVGVAALRAASATWQIDTFLLSCRVIGRKVETAFLAFLLDELSREGVHTITGWFIPSKKNAPACDFYAIHGFHLVEESSDGTKWTLDLCKRTVKAPAWMKVKVLAELEA